MSTICRTCLRRANQTFRINQTLPFGDTTAKISFVLRFCIPELYLGLSTNPEICYDCKESLKVAYVFKKKCLKTENILGDFLKGVRCTGRSVELKDVLGHLDEQAKQTLDTTKTQESVFNAEDIISEWEDPPDSEADCNELPLIEVRQSAPNPMHHEKPDELEFCDESGVFVDKQGNTFDFAGRAVVKKNTLSRILKGIIENDESINSLNTQLGMVPNIEPNSDSLFKITSVFSLSEDTEKNTNNPTTIDSNIESFITDKESDIITNNQDLFEIKYEPLDETNLSDRLDFNFTPTDEDTLDASETASYGNMQCDTDFQGIIDSISDINDSSHQYVDVPDFVQINNFGLRELEEFRKQQLEQDKEPPKVNETQTNVNNEIQSPKQNHVILKTRVLSDALYINGKQMVKCPEGYKFSGVPYAVTEDVKSTGAAQQTSIGVQVKPVHPRRGRRVKIVPVDDTGKKIKVTQKVEDKDIVVLYTNYTMDGIYVNDHDYLVNPYKRNKILVEAGDEWLCMCYICHKQHHIYDHVQHMIRHGRVCKVCKMDLGTPFMLNVHAKSHTKPCKHCTERVPYGLIDSHEEDHMFKFQETEFDIIKEKYRRKKSHYFRNVHKKVPDVASETLVEQSVVKEDPDRTVCVKEESAPIIKRGRKRKVKSEGIPPVKTRVLRSKARKSYNETELGRIVTNNYYDGTEVVTSAKGPP